MATNLSGILNRLSTARTEFQSSHLSVLNSFAIPYYINSNNLANIDNSISLQGSRGCGKTMYLRYFSHWTQFDKRNHKVTEDSLRSIVLYWKPDTAFCRAINKEWLSEQNARLFFLGLSTLEILYEITSALDNISYHFPEIKDNLHLYNNFWSAIHNITNNEFDSLDKLFQWIKQQVYSLHISVNSNNTDNVFLGDPRAMSMLLIPALQTDCQILAKSRFKIFVDEFENLSVSQQRIINSYRKHSDRLISWNVAHKHNAKITTQTEGDEQIQGTDDYKSIILDNLLKKSDSDYKFLSYEILLLTLSRTGIEFDDSPLDLENLGDIDYLSSRLDKNYRQYVKSIIQRILPQPTSYELASIGVSNKSAIKKISHVLKKNIGLDEASIKYLLDNHPDIALTTWGIYKQRSFSPQLVKSFLSSKNLDPAFKEKINTYLYASVFKLNLDNSYIDIPIYSGADRFCTISSYNFRHFLDLCYHSFREMSDFSDPITTINDFPCLTYQNMHEGARNASILAVDETTTFSPMGQTLSRIVKRFGDLFKLCHKGDFLSEPEVNHYYITSDYGQFSDEILGILEIAKCWRVLIEYPATKDKDRHGSALYEYQLNPIYSPNFGITYRKNRRLEISQDDFRVICLGDSDEYENLRDRYKNKWYKHGSYDQGTLF